MKTIILSFVLTTASFVGIASRVNGQDRNGDQLDDIWQARYAAGRLSAVDDTDGDGVPNKAEQRAGTDPFDADSRLRVKKITRTTDSVIVEWRAEAEKIYQVEAASSPEGKWRPVADSVAPVKPGLARQVISQRVIPDAEASFFRVRVEDADNDGDGLSAWAERVLGTSDDRGKAATVEGWSIDRDVASVLLNDYKIIQPGVRPTGPGVFLPNPGAEPGYVQVGLLPAWDSEGVDLLRTDAADFNMEGGQMIHAAEAGGGTAINSWSGVLELPFYFQFYGTAVKKFCVSKNGLLTFDTSVASKVVGQEDAAANRNAEITKNRINVGVLTLGQDPRVGDGAFQLTAGGQVGQAAGQGAVEGVLTPGQGQSPLEIPTAGLPNLTIAYFWSVFLPLSPSHDIYAFSYGAAPHRQVWIVNRGHRKKGQISTYSAVVLEETSNRVYVVDMWREQDGDDQEKGFCVVGVQRNKDIGVASPLSPNVPIVSKSLSQYDNAFYQFEPTRVGQNVSGDGAASLDGLDDMLSEFIDANNIPGMTVAASKNGRLVYNKGFGLASVEQGIPMQNYHRAGIGSVSKIITTLGVMKLQEIDPGFALDDGLYGDGGLLAGPDYQSEIWEGIDNAIDNDVCIEVANLNSKYTINPDVANDEWCYTQQQRNWWFIEYHKITMRSLLTHTSGFDGESGSSVTDAMGKFGVDYEDVTYLQAHRTFLIKRQLGFRPGKCRKYTNHNLGLAGNIIQVRSGVPYSSFIYQHILHPLGLDTAPKRAFLDQQTALDSARYPWYDSGVPYRVSDFDAARVYGAYGYKRTDLGLSAGGWESSARDLVRLLCATDQLSNQSDVLTAESLDEMESVPFPSTDSGQAHGWRKSGTKVAHSGLHGEGAAYMAKWGTEFNVAVVINTGNDVNLGTVAGNVKDAVQNANVPFNYDLFDSAVLNTLKIGQ